MHEGPKPWHRVWRPSIVLFPARICLAEYAPCGVHQFTVLPPRLRTCPCRGKGLASAETRHLGLSFPVSSPLDFSFFFSPVQRETLAEVPAIIQTYGLSNTGISNLFSYLPPTLDSVSP